MSEATRDAQAVLTAFLEALDERSRAALAGREAELRAWLAAALAEAHTTWPDVDIADCTYIGHLAAKVAALADAADFGRLCVGDLYLSCACLEGNAAAIAAVEQLCRPELERAASRMRLGRTTADDLASWLREELFCPPQKARAIAGYSGRSSLRSWVRTVAMRAALKEKQKQQAEVGDDALGDLASGADPELAYIRQLRAREFREALGRALAALGVRERNLLRQHYLDQVGLEALARLYHVHRATVARWISDARHAVSAGIRRDLAERLSPSEVESLLRAVTRSMDIEISQALRTP